MPGGLTTTQFSVLYRLGTQGAMSQNMLGRSVEMDGATTKGVVDRLAQRGLLATAPDPADRRRRTAVSPGARRAAVLAGAIAAAKEVTRTTLAPLRPAERKTFLRLLARLM